MNDDERETPPAGNPPAVPLPVASPRHPSPPRRSTTKEIALDAIVAGAARARARRPLNYTLIGVVITALTTGVVTGLKKSSNATDDAKTTDQRLDRLERKVKRLSERHEALKRAVPVRVDEPEESEERP